MWKRGRRVKENEAAQPSDPAGAAIESPFCLVKLGSCRLMRGNGWFPKTAVLAKNLLGCR